MKVSIQVLGSLGDVMPYISTALALKQDGVDVSILAPRDFTALIQAHGITAADPPAFTLDGWMQQAAMRGTLDNPVRFFRDWPDMIAPHVDDVMARCLRAADGADVIAANLICAPARIAAEAHGAALQLSCQQPVLSPTHDHPCAMMWRPWHGSALNRVSYTMIRIAHRVIGPALQRHRKALGLAHKPTPSDLRTHLGAPLTKVTTIPWPLIRERPADWSGCDHLTPYPSLVTADTAELAPDLMAFLKTGPPPIYVGLGSLGSAHGGALFKAAIDGLSATGHRGLIARPMVPMDAVIPDTVFVMDPAPHDIVFPYCTAVIHHGGAGTTDTALRAGIPQILQPHFLDQFWYAHRLKLCGVAPQALPTRCLTGDHMARAIRDAHVPAIVEAAQTLGKQARSVDGTQAFAHLIRQGARAGGG